MLFNYFIHCSCLNISDVFVCSSTDMLLRVASWLPLLQFVGIGDSRQLRPFVVSFNCRHTSIQPRDVRQSEMSQYNTDTRNIVMPFWSKDQSWSCINAYLEVKNSFTVLHSNLHTYCLHTNFLLKLSLMTLKAWMTETDLWYYKDLNIVMLLIFTDKLKSYNHWIRRNNNNIADTW